MNKAIVSGANGLIGSAVVLELLRHNVDVLCLGRKDIKEFTSSNLFEVIRPAYIKVDMSDILSLTDKIKEISWDPGNSCVFYNFAWSGQNRISDGGVEDQIKNVTNSANAVIVAKRIGCSKFINVGSMEETFIEKYFESDWLKKNYHSKLGIYAVSKLAARDMCTMVAYLEKIDYIHTRLSVPISPNKPDVGYISSTLKKILNGESYSPPENNQLFDLISLEDVVNAFYLIGEKGKNKADYFIGTGYPKELNVYFKKFRCIVKGVDENQFEYSSINEKTIDAEAFNIDNLVHDTGFVVSGTFEDFVKKLIKG